MNSKFHWLAESINSLKERVEYGTSYNNRFGNGNHKTNSFNECRSASQLDKNVIAKVLADKKFNYINLRGRANDLSNRFSAANSKSVNNLNSSARHRQTIVSQSGDTIMPKREKNFTVENSKFIVFFFV